MVEKKEWLVVGIITSPHGLRGNLIIKSFSDFNERFTKPGKRWLQKNDEEPVLFELISGYKKPGKEIFIVTFKGINDRNQAEKFNKYKLLVRNKDLPKLNTGEFHISELINLKVKLFENNQLTTIGIVCDFLTDNNHLIVVEIFENKKKVLIPFVKEIIPTIDKAKKFLIIKPPKGLLDL